MIKILIVAEETERNTFIKNLTDSLKPSCEVVIGIQKFWESESNYDIIHFHWPEHLSFRIKRKSLPPTPNKLKKIKARIQDLKTGGAKLVLTRHNSQSHEYEKGFSKLYDYLNQVVDGVIHMGAYSVQEYSTLYPSSLSQHTIIPHGWYHDIPNTKTFENARAKLGLSTEAFVILAFGAFRNKEEEDFVIEAFKKLDLPRKQLIIPRGFFFNNFLFFRLLDYLKLNFYKKLIKRKKKKLAPFSVHWDQKFTSKDEIQDYFNASNVVLIPRLKILNSGNVPLAFYFQKPVIGPNQGNVGSILKETGNLIFDVKSVDSLTNAMQNSINKNSKGNENYQFAKENWNWRIIGQSHINFYTSLI